MARHSSKTALNDAIPFGLDASQRAALVEILVGSVVISVCFASLCAYAAHQRQELNRDAKPVQATVQALPGRPEPRGFLLPK
ncbi:MAG: hypothetical protein JWP91_264 [Fibrobacteres bacterium]|nr:hypothetical protein [Fibrobacterota bacterium]